MTKRWAGVAALVVLLVAGGAVIAHLLRRGADPIAETDLLTKRHEYGVAQVVLRNAIHDAPDNAEYHRRLGVLQVVLGDPVAGEKELKRALELGADSRQVSPTLGRALLGQQRYKEVLAVVPPEGPTPATLARNMILRATAQIGLGDLDGAKATLAVGERALPLNYVLRMTQARLALMTKDYELAIAKADSLQGTNPRRAEPLVIKSTAFLLAGKPAEAFAAADQAVALAPSNVEARLGRARLLMAAGEDAKAQADVDAVLAMGPGHNQAIYLHAELMTHAGKYAEAFDDLQQVSPLVAEFPRVPYLQAIADFHLDKIEVAVEHASTYAAHNPKDPDGIRLLARMQMAAHRPARAAEVLAKAVEDGMGDPQMLGLLKEAQAAMGEPLDGNVTGRQAAEKGP